MKTDLLVIASYPLKGEIHSKPAVGVASYTKNTLKSLPQDLAITVLAEKIKTQEDSYKEKNVSVLRIWQRNTFLTLPNLFFRILKDYKKEKDIIIAFELAMFGEILSLALFPFFILALRLVGKRVTLICHQVIIDMKEVSGHIYIPKDSPMLFLLNIFAHMFYRMLLLFATKIIVFEDTFRDRLSRFGDKKKIVVIAHGVEQFHNFPTMNEARSKLGIPHNRFVVLYFGFVAWYKGTDWLIHLWKNQPNTSLIIAGGPNLNHLGKKHYQKYIAAVEEACKKKHITYTGFVPEEEISLYFQAADLVVFPYRTLMSASGPLSMAFSFNKPFMLSNKIEGVFDTSDFKNLLQKLNMNRKTLVFSWDQKINEKVDSLSHSPFLLAKAAELSKKLAKARSWKIIGRTYYETLFGN